MAEEIQEEIQQEENAPTHASFEDGTIKVDLRTDAVQERETETVDVGEQPAASEGMDEEVREQPEQIVEQPVQDEQPILQEVTDEEIESAAEQLDEQVAEAVAESQESGIELPENIQKVVDFMNETGGTLEDYVRLNTDYSTLNEDQLLREYYQTTNPHLDAEDIDFMLEDKFSYDEDLDDEREVRRKKVERKQALANAKNHLDGLKSKYYEEIKMGSKLTPDQQKAVEFFNRYNKENEEAAKIAERQASRFKAESEKVFGEGFEGFDYQVGEKKYRFKVNNAAEVKQTQGDINNFIKKFLNENNEMSDARGYHKSLFTAMNADKVAQHFYEQGRADAIKDSTAKSKNVDMDPRGVHTKAAAQNGWTVRILDEGTSSSKLRVRMKK